MSKDDIPYVMEIEHESFFSPYPVEFFYRFRKSPGCLIIVAQTESEIVGGYIACKLRRRDRMEVVSIAVGERSRRRGLGKQLLQAGIEYAARNGCVECCLHVSVVNFPAQQLYTSLGFKFKEWVKEYYATEHEDALIMELNWANSDGSEKCSLS